MGCGSTKPIDLSPSLKKKVSDIFIAIDKDNSKTIDK